MSESELWNEVLNDTLALVKQSAKERRGTLSLSPDTAALLERVQAYAASAPESDTGPGVAREDLNGQDDGRISGLAALAEEVAACRRCGLCDTRTQTVFSDGPPFAELVFVGEAPGAEEDRQGLPFVGRAGQLLTDIIVKGMKLKRGDVYICNVLKCRPPENRNPRPEEIEQCEPYLIRQLEWIRPKAICALGTYAAQTLLKTTESIGRLRGKWHEYHGIPLRVTYHPAYLLRTPADKAKTWTDILEVMKVLNGTAPQ